MKLHSITTLLCAVLSLQAGWILSSRLENQRSYLFLKQKPPDAETSLSLGLPIKLSNARLYELELIPKINDTLALSILEKRDAVIKKSIENKNDSRCKALELVHGIGEKTALRLCPWIAIE